ncbi:MAG: ATP-binding protein [Candidatus Wallbacteria bacterium]
MTEKVNYLEKLSNINSILASNSESIEKTINLFLKVCGEVFSADFSFMKFVAPASSVQDSFSAAGICYVHDGKYFFNNVNNNTSELFNFYNTLNNSCGIIRQTLGSHEIIFWPSSTELNFHELSILKERNLTALAIVPLFVKDNHTATIWLETNNESAALDNDKTGFIKIASALFEAYLEKNITLDFIVKEKKSEFNFETAINSIFYDIEKKAESKVPELQHSLIKNNLRYQHLLNNEKQIIFTLDTAGTITTVSKLVEELTGYSSHELINKNIFEGEDVPFIKISPEYKPLAKKMFDLKVAGTLDNTSYEIEVISKDNKVYFLEVNSTAVTLNGKTVEILVTAKNITEHKYDNKILTAILNSSSEGIMVLRAIRNGSQEIIDFEIQVLNKAAEKLLGKKACDMIGRRLLTELPESIENKLFERYIKTVKTGLPLNYEQFYEFDGNEFWLRISANKLDDGVIINFSDVTYQKQAEKELQEKIHFNETLLDSIPYPVILINSGRQILSMNKAALEFNETICDVCHEIFDKYSNSLFVSENTQKSYKINAVEISGHLWNINIINIYEDIHLFYAVDISDLIEKNISVEKNSLAKISITSLQKDFLTIVSHEIRTPMNSVIGFTELLGETKLSQRQAEYLSFIRSSSLSLLNVLNDIIDYACIVSNNFILQNYEFDVQKVIKEILDSIQNELSAKYLKLALDISDNMPKYLCGDPMRLKQVVTNLLNNAIKFTQSGEIKVIIKITGEDSNIANLYVEIKDCGIGIAEENLEKIFAPFTQADNSYTRKYGGNGLGLSISNSIVKLMGGKRIFVKSTPGEGSNFFFTLPLKKHESDFKLPAVL